MKTILGLLIFYCFCFLNGNLLRAQEQKIEVRPYTIQTTYEKLKGDYPFIKPIEALKSGPFISKENLIYKSIEGLDLKADVFIPKDTAEKHTAILLVFGGGWISGSKANVKPLAQHFAANGYVAVTADYRLSTEAVYPAAVKDLKAAIRWMRDHAEEFHIDSKKIAILGNSAGAQLATLVGVTRNSEIYKDAQDLFSGQC